MKIDFDKFLTITMLLACPAACTVNTAQDKSDAGESGAKGVAGSGGQPTQSPDSGASTSDASTVTPCLDQLASGAGSMEGVCDILPYANANCDPGSEGGDPGSEGGDPGSEGGDPGSEGYLAPYGAAMCWGLEEALRPGVMEALAACLGRIGGDPCSETHDKAAASCYLDTIPRACSQDASKATCMTIRAGCAAVRADECEVTLNAFDSVTYPDILACISLGSLEDACDEAFENCLWNRNAYR